MIRFLHVRDLAIIKDLSLELRPGLNLLTGETGAGKSILVDALLQGLGARSDAGLVRTGASSASVEIEFDLEGDGEAVAFLEEKGYGADGGSLVVHREVAAGGRSRAFIGGVLAPVADLRALGSRLVSLHGQHDHQSLLDPALHRVRLDRHARLEERLREMRAAFHDLREAATRLESLRDGSHRIAQRIDMLRWQVQEIDQAAVAPKERAALRSERDILRHAETLLRHCGAALEALYEGESTAIGRLTDGLRSAREVARFDPGFEADLTRAEAARADLEELAIRLRDFAARVQPDPQRLQSVDDRLHLIDLLVRKYAPDGDEDTLLSYRERAAAELLTLTDGGETVADLERRVADLRARAAGIAGDLSRRRGAAAALLERGVEAELAELAMPGTRFAVERRTRPETGSGVFVEGEEVAVDAAGCDVVEFLLSANRGEAMRPLASVASGGELSRLMLALEVVLLGSAAPRTLVFDEVDAGIGGEVAEAVGRKLRSLAASHQVVCVTHLAPIASKADRHLKVEKRVARGRTEVQVAALAGDDRVRELARMMAGGAITPSALRHAEELLSRSQGGA